MGINLKNFIWNRDPQEAMDNPYEWEAQRKFVKEALVFLKEIRRFIIESHSFTKENRSMEKASWMLSLAALDSGIEILYSLRRNQIQVIFHLIGSIQESMDLGTYFTYNDDTVFVNLEKWYGGKIIPHREYRDLIRSKGDVSEYEYLRSIYIDLSNFNHNGYPSLLYNYFLSSDDVIHHYGRYESNSTKPSNTISMLHAVSARLILNLCFRLPILGVLTRKELDKFIGNQDRKREVKRRVIKK